MRFNPLSPHRPKRGFLLALVVGLVSTALLLAQEARQQAQPPAKEQEKKAEKQKAARRLFGGGKVTLVSSRQESDTAAHGFKGVGEDGRVTRAALTAEPSGEDFAKVTQMTSAQVSPEDLSVFLTEAGLRGRSERRPGGA